MFRKKVMNTVLLHQSDEISRKMQEPPTRQSPFQEEYDREVEEVKRNYEESANGAEESEWIEYDNSNQGR